MNSQSRTFTTAIITLTAALTLTACGSDNDSPSDDKEIAGADNSDKPEPPSPSPTPSDEPVKRPTLKIPNTFKMHFPGWTSADPKKQAVLNDGKERMRAVNEAILQNPANPDSKNVEFYSSSTALKSSKNWIAGFKKNNLTIIGEVTYKDPQVKLRDDGNAVLVYCADESNGTAKDLKTGNENAAPTSSEFQLYNTLLEKNSQGVWQTIQMINGRGKCK